MAAGRCLREGLFYFSHGCHGLGAEGKKGILFESSWHQHRDIMKQRRSAVKSRHASGI